jgi:hypothetical protein
VSEQSVHDVEHRADVADPDRDGEEPGGLPRTGDPGVDAALDRLRELGPDSSPAEHLPVLASVHETLQQRLSAAAE